MMENLQQLVNLMAENSDLKGSFVEELLQTMLSGEFMDVDGDVESSDKVIGEMNDLDKALNTLADRYAKTEKCLVDKFRRVDICDEEIELEEKKQMKAELRQARDRFKIVNNFRWANIYDRFGHFDEPRSTGFGVRAGYKVVLLFGGHDYGNSLEAILALGALRRMMED